MSYKHLSVCERAALMLESGKTNFSPRQFAKQIKRHHSTIYRELKRHTLSAQPYNADQVLAAAAAKRRRGHRKIDLQSTLWAFIVACPASLVVTSTNC